MTADQLRTARLLLGPRGGAHEEPGAPTAEQVGDPRLRRLLGGGKIPSGPIRLGQRAAMRFGLLDWQRRCLDPLASARAQILGAEAAGDPRLLVRVDEFPHADVVQRPGDCGTGAYRRFHELLEEAGMPYLIAIVPQPADRPYDPAVDRRRDLDPDERAMIARMRVDGVTPAVHGLDHRTTDARPRHHAELIGHGDEALDDRLATAARVVEEVAGPVRVLVPPFNRFRASQYHLLAKRFDVVCGGPESVVEMGLQPSPQFRDGSVYLPSYPPLYGRSAEVSAAVRTLLQRQLAIWAPIVLHWEWEARDDFASLRTLLEQVAPYAVSWEKFLAAVDATDSRSNDNRGATT